MQWLRSFGVEELVINLSHVPEAVRGHFGDGSRWDVRITYSVEAEPLGTAGGVKRMAAFFDEPFVVWYGDNLSACDLFSMATVHRTIGSPATIAVRRRNDVSASGVVLLDDRDQVRRLVEKPPQHEALSGWVSAGIFILDPSVLESIPERGTPDFGRDVFPGLIER